MTEAPIIRSVMVECFRGFLERKTIVLDASVVIVSGPNGSGKTSLFDAIQWLFLGRIERLANLAGKRSGDYVVSRFGADRQPAIVSAELRVNGQHVVLRRAGNARSSSVTWQQGPEVLDGEVAEARLRDALLGESQLALRDAMLTSGLLQQDVVRAVLEDEPKQRYRHMAAMLGLTDLSGFEDATKSTAESTRKSAAVAVQELDDLQARLERERGELARLEDKLVSEPDVRNARAELHARLAQTAFSFTAEDLPATARDAVSLGQWARRVRNSAAELERLDAELAARNAGTHDVNEAEVGRAVNEHIRAGAQLDAAREAVVDAQARHESARALVSRLVELATVALPLLDSRCPVCEQTIDPSRVGDHLRSLMGGDDAELRSARQALSAAQLQAAQAAETTASAAAERTRRETEWEALRDIAHERSAWVASCGALAAELVSTYVEDTAELAQGSRQALDRVQRSADVVAGVADELAAVLGATGLASEVARQRVLVEQMNVSATEGKSTAAEESARAASAKTLASAASEATAGVARRRFATLQPLIDDIFGRLEPHPEFRSLGLELTVAYRSGVADAVVRTESGVTGDPLLVFSSSQANVAALTYFLAVSWAAGPQALPFLLLDDPLQSMDDINALGFADLCRHIRGRRQLLVSTHDRRLASLLERKLSPRVSDERTRVIRFVGWSARGPELQEEEILSSAADVGYVLAG